MNKAKALLFVSAILVWLGAQAQSLPGMRVRGSITGFDGQVLQVKTRDGIHLHIGVTDQTRISAMVPLQVSDIKPGSFIGVTAVPKAPGQPLLAREVHVFAEAQRGMGEGHYAWDLEPGSTMTNANVDAIVDRIDGKELSLSYKDGSQKILVPPSVPVVTFKPAGKSQLRKGAPIFCITVQGEDGSVNARYIGVGRHGKKPPM